MPVYVSSSATDALITLWLICVVVAVIGIVAEVRTKKASR